MVPPKTNESYFGGQFDINSKKYTSSKKLFALQRLLKVDPRLSIKLNIIVFYVITFNIEEVKYLC